MGTWGNFGATDREMKLCSGLLFSAAVAAQYADDAGTDRWGNYDYVGGFTYPTEGKDDGGNSEKNDFSGMNHYNGLYCWMCDERLDLGVEAETTSVNAYARCLNNGMRMKCTGEQRTCMFEERRRNGVVYSVCTGCKQTDACLALWRRNQRFTLPFMNFGDMSLSHHADGKPIYVDDECTAYQETKTHRKVSTLVPVFPMPSSATIPLATIRRMDKCRNGNLRAAGAVPPRPTVFAISKVPI